MKKWGKRVSIVLVLCVLLSGTLTDVAVFAPDVVQAANAIGLDEEGWLGLQDSYVLKIKKTKQKVSWSSSNTKIVKVTQNGKITGVGYGEAVVTAKVGTKKYQCKVNVYAPTILAESNCAEKGNQKDCTNGNSEKKNDKSGVYQLRRACKK